MNLKEAIKLLDEEFSYNADFISRIIESLNMDKNAKILDIGTGRGVMAINLALHGYSVITGEPEEDKWSDWRTEAKKVHVENLIEFTPLRAENLPFEDSIFDYIFLYVSFHHISDKYRTLKECVRVNKKQGLIIIIELTPKGIEEVRKNYPSHTDAVDPRDFVVNLPLSIKTIESPTINAYIFKKKIKKYNLS